MSLLGQVEDHATEAKLAWLYDRLQKVSDQFSELLERSNVIETRLAVLEVDMHNIHRNTWMTISILIVSLLAFALSISTLTAVLLIK